MGAALLNWIHDNSMDQQFVDHWNKAQKKERNALLKAAGRDSIHRFKAWEFVPADVRVDVVHIIERQAKNQSKPAAPKPAPREMWYDKL